MKSNMIDTVNFSAAMYPLPDDQYLITENKKFRQWNWDGLNITKHHQNKSPFCKIDSSLSRLFNLHHDGIDDNFPIMPINQIDNFVNEMCGYYGINPDESFLRAYHCSFDVVVSEPEIYNACNFRIQDAKLISDPKLNLSSIEHHITKDHILTIYDNGNHNNRPKGIRIENKFYKKQITTKGLKFLSAKNINHHRNAIHQILIDKLSYHDGDKYIIDHPDNTLSESKKKQRIEYLCGLSTMEFYLLYNEYMIEKKWKRRDLRQLENEREIALQYISLISNRDKIKENIINTLNSLT